MMWRCKGRPHYLSRACHHRMPIGLEMERSGRKRQANCSWVVADCGHIHERVQPFIVLSLHLKYLCESFWMKFLECPGKLNVALTRSITASTLE